MSDARRIKMKLGSLLGLIVSLSTALSAQQTPGRTTRAGQKAGLRPQLVLQQGHTAEVQAMAFSPDSSLLATAAGNGEVALWDLRTGDRRYSFTVDASWPIGLAIAPDGKTLAPFVGSGKASLRDITSRRLLRTLDHGSEPAAIAFSPEGSTLALGGHSPGLSLWNYRTGRRLRAINTHIDEMGDVGVLAFSPDGSRLASADGESFQNGAVEIWNVRDGTLAATLPSHAVHSVAFSPDGKTLAVGSGGFVQGKPVVELWDLAQQKIVKRLTGEEFDLISLAFSRDGGQIAAGDAQGLLIVWDVSVGTVLRTMGVKNFVVHSAVSPDARLGATADYAGTVRVYELGSGKLLRLLSGPIYRWSTAAFSADGAALIVGGGMKSLPGDEQESHNALLAWDTHTGAWKDLHIALGPGVTHMDRTADGAQAVTSDAKNLVQIWRLQPEGAIHSIVKRKRRVLAIAVSPKAPTVVLVGTQPKAHPTKTLALQGRRAVSKEDPLIEMVDLRTGRTIRTLAGHRDLVNGVNYSADGARFATLSYDRTLILWNARTGAIEHRISTGKTTPECLTLSRDGRLAAIGYEYAPMCVLETHTGRIVRSFPLPDQIISSVALSPKGDWVAEGGGDGVVRAWNIQSGQVREMNTQSNSIAWVGFSPTEPRLASLDRRGLLRLWDYRAGKLIATFLMVDAQNWLAFTPEGFYEGSPGVDSFLRWRVGDQLFPANRYHMRFYRPDKVQTALSGNPQPVRYARLLDHEKILDRRLAHVATELKPTKKLEKKADTPTDALKAALTTMGELGDTEIREKVHAQVKAQLIAGADPNVQGDWGTSPLMFLAACGDVAGVRDLLNRKANVNLVDFYGATALLEAVQLGHEEMVPLLLEAGADLKDEQGRSLLKLKGDRKALSAAMLHILQLGANQFGAPLQHFNTEGTAWMLLYLGADPNVRNVDGRTPVIYAFSPFLMKELLVKGADPNARDKAGTPVIVALSISGQTELVKLLLDHGADVNAAEKQGWTALMFAAQNGHSDLAKLVLERGADSNHATEDGRTPLMFAVGGGCLEITHNLLEKGARVNAKDNEGWTPLTYAVNREDATVVKLLLDKGSDIHVRTKDKQTLLQLLRQGDANDAFGIGKLLKQAGARE